MSLNPEALNPYALIRKPLILNPEATEIKLKNFYKNGILVQIQVLNLFQIILKQNGYST